MILLCVLMTLKDGISLRGVSKGIQSFFSVIYSNLTLWIPSYTTINRWIKRIGLYKLWEPLEQASDWIAIGDTSIGIGTKKVVMILGIRLAAFRTLIAKNQPLRLQDVKPLYMKIVESCNGDVVCDAFEQAQIRVGKLCQMCTDGGSDMQCGGRLFAEKILKKEGRKIHITYDTPHKVACFLKAAFENSPKFLQLSSQAAATSHKHRQSKFAHLIPPNQRSKARYMNLDELVNWANQTLMVLDMQECMRKKIIAITGRKPATEKCDMLTPLGDEEYKELLEGFGWLTEIREDIQMFNEYALIGAMTRHIVRTHGLHIGTYQELDKQLNNLPLKFQESYQFCGECLEFIETQTKGLKEGDLLLGSDEVIESLYGKIKVLLNEDAKHGLTSFVLAASAACGDLDEGLIEDAFCAVKDEDVQEWSRLNLGATHISKRRRCYKFAKNLISKSKIATTIFGAKKFKEEGLPLSSDEITKSLDGKMKVLFNEDVKDDLTSFVTAAPATDGNLDERIIEDVQEVIGFNLETTQAGKRHCYKFAKKLISRAQISMANFCKMGRKATGYF